MVYIMQSAFLLMTLYLFPAKHFGMEKFSYPDHHRNGGEANATAAPGEIDVMTLSRNEEAALQELAKAIWKEAKGEEMQGVTVRILDQDGNLLSLGRGSH